MICKVQKSGFDIIYDEPDHIISAGAILGLGFKIENFSWCREGKSAAGQVE